MNSGNKEKGGEGCGNRRRGAGTAEIVNEGGCGNIGGRGDVGTDASLQVQREEDGGGEGGIPEGRR